MQYSFGWLPDYPDMRDRTFGSKAENTKPAIAKDERASVKTLRDKAKSQTRKAKTNRLPKSVTGLEKHFLPVDDQGKFNSCTAHAGCSLIEYFENKTHGDCEKKSRAFLYKVTRNLLQIKGDTGTFVRSTMKAMVLFGLPPERYWDYNDENLDAEPTQFCYAFAQNYQAIQYYRLDADNITPEELLREIKINLVKELPLMFGFTVYSNVARCKDGKITFPTSRAKLISGHAMVALGYDDEMEIKNEDDTICKGALRIRNSWGEEWGEEGYGWLPYDYVLKGLALDWWSVIKNEWIDTNAFK